MQRSRSSPSGQTPTHGDSHTRTLSTAHRASRAVHWTLLVAILCFCTTCRAETQPREPPAGASPADAERGPAELLERGSPSPLAVTAANGPTDGGEGRELYSCSQYWINGRYYCEGDCCGSGSGGSSTTTCSAGTYRSGTSCYYCPTGKYKTTRSTATSCTSCPSGKYNQYSGSSSSTSCRTCSSGRYSPSGSSSCRTCSSGSYSVSGSSSCTNCPQGRYQSSSQSASCTLCPTGKYNPYTGSSSCRSCPTGYTSSAGSTSSSSCTSTSSGSPGTSGGASSSRCTSGCYNAVVETTLCTSRMHSWMHSNMGSSNTVQPGCHRSTYYDGVKHYFGVSSSSLLYTHVRCNSDGTTVTAKICRDSSSCSSNCMETVTFRADGTCYEAPEGSGVYQSARCVGTGNAAQSGNDGADGSDASGDDSSSFVTILVAGIGAVLGGAIVYSVWRRRKNRGLPAGGGLNGKALSLAGSRSQAARSTAAASITTVKPTQPKAAAGLAYCKAPASGREHKSIPAAMGNPTVIPVHLGTDNAGGAAASKGRGAPPRKPTSMTSQKTKGPARQSPVSQATPVAAASPLPLSLPSIPAPHEVTSLPPGYSMIKLQDGSFALVPSASLTGVVQVQPHATATQ